MPFELNAYCMLLNHQRIIRASGRMFSASGLGGLVLEDFILRAQYPQRESAELWKRVHEEGPQEFTLSLPDIIHPPFSLVWDLEYFGYRAHYQDCEITVRPILDGTEVHWTSGVTLPSGSTMAMAHPLESRPAVWIFGSPEAALWDLVLYLRTIEAFGLHPEDPEKQGLSVWEHLDSV